MARLLALLCLLAPLSAWGDDAAELAPDDLAALVERGSRQTFQLELDAADATWAEIQTRAPADPAGYVYAVDTCFWRQMVAGRRDQEERIVELSKQAVELADARLDEDDDDAAAHFYKGVALMHLARVEMDRGNPIRAGSTGEKGRDQLERALELRPDWVDVKYQLGLYYYYASILPQMFSMLSFLWFVPEGDGPTGLGYLDEVAHSDALHRHDAAFVLGTLRAYHDPREPQRGIALYEPLREEFPENRLILQELAQMHYAAKRYEDVVEQTQALEAIASDEDAESARVWAVVWRARAQLQLGRTASAVETLDGLGPDGPDEPSWARSWVWLLRGGIKDVDGERGAAREYYQRVVDLEAPLRNEGAVRLAQVGLEEPFALEGLPTVGAEE